MLLVWGPHLEDSGWRCGQVDQGHMLDQTTGGRVAKRSHSEAQGAGTVTGTPEWGQGTATARIPGFQG